MSEAKTYMHISKHPEEAVTLDTGYRVQFRNWGYTTDDVRIQKLIERSRRFGTGQIYLADSKAEPESTGPKTSRGVISTETPEIKDDVKVRRGRPFKKETEDENN